MQTSIASVLTEMTIEQRLEEIKVIGAEKDKVDSMLLELNDVDPIKGVAFYDWESSRLEFKIPAAITRQITPILEEYLKQRREELLAIAENLMK